MSEDNTTSCLNEASIIYDKFYYINQLKTSSLIQRVGLEKIFEILNTRSPYDYVKIIALERWYKSLLEQLDYFNNLTYCRKYNDTLMETISHDVFNWSHDEFLKRRQMKDCVWIQALLRGSSANCLSLMKLRTDLREIKKYIVIMYELLIDWVVHVKQPDMEVKVLRPLRAAQEYPQLLIENVKEGIEMNTYVIELRKMTIQERVIGVIKEQNKKIKILEKAAAHMHVWLPIEFRYRTNWLSAQTSENLFPGEKNIWQAEKDIIDYRHKLFTEKNCSDSICDAYYADSENYKQRFNDMQDRFDIDFEEVQGSIHYRQNQIQKFKTQKRHHQATIVRFHEEIEQRLVKDERLRIKEEKDRLAEEAAGLARYRAEQSKREKLALKALKDATDVKGKYARQKVIAKIEKRMKSVIKK